MRFNRFLFVLLRVALSVWASYIFLSRSLLEYHYVLRWLNTHVVYVCMYSYVHVHVCMCVCVRVDRMMTGWTRSKCAGRRVVSSTWLQSHAQPRTFQTFCSYSWFLFLRYSLLLVPRSSIEITFSFFFSDVVYVP